MFNFALRKIFQILTEKVARLEILYYEKLIEGGPNHEFFMACQKTLDNIKAEILSNKELLLQSYHYPLGEEHLGRSLFSVKKSIVGFLQLHTLLGYLPQNNVLPESFTFLDKSLNGNNKILETKSRYIFLTRDYLYETQNFHDLVFNSEFANDLGLCIPRVENVNPLYWVLLVKNAFLNIVEKMDLQTIVNEIIGDRNLTSERRYLLQILGQKLVLDVFALRLFGPAYFYMMVEHGVFKRIAESEKIYLSTLAVREELMYEQLVKYNMADQANATHGWFTHSGKLAEPLYTAFGFREDYSDIKDLLNSLIERLNTEVVNKLGESALFIQADLDNSLTANHKLHHNEDITGILHNPKQIANAGWIYKETRLDKLFLEFLESENNDFSIIGNSFRNLDNTIITAISELV